MLTPGDWVEQRYRVAGVVAAGGTAIIYRVQTRQGAVRALKLPRRTVPELVARLRQEARVLALLQHPNIVAIEDTVEVGGLPGLILELVSEGRTLASVITESRGLMSVSRLHDPDGKKLRDCDAINDFLKLNKYLVFKRVGPTTLFSKKN